MYLWNAERDPPPVVLYVFTHKFIFTPILFTRRGPAGYAKKLETIYGQEDKREKPTGKAEKHGKGERTPTSEKARETVPEKSAYFIPR